MLDHSQIEDLDMLDQIATFRKEVKPGFELRAITHEEFLPHFHTSYPLVFGKKFDFDVQGSLSQREKDRLEELDRHMGSPLCLRFALFHGEKFVGWQVGDQKSRFEYYMRNSGVLPEYRGQGLYTAMVVELMKLLKDLGFQVISSNHNATNNAILIPKLKLGFIIAGMTISDRFGTLLTLEYFTNPLRRHVMDVRSGQAFPSPEAKALMALS